MSEAWVALRIPGDPGTRALPWAAYSADRREMMLSDRDRAWASLGPHPGNATFLDQVAATS